VRLADDDADVRAYREIYAEARARWGADATTDHPPALFAAAWEAAREHPELARLWIAEVEGELAAGAWVFYWNDHAVWWHGAARERFSGCAPQNVLQVEILRDACARDFHWYDFNPSGGHAGVARFKSHFGARELPLEHWIWASPKLWLFPRPRGRSRA
jgi:lipid II:glycine glycyltransferase (peptidoglycan interpeptide bridge formation enzyme)